MSNGSGSSSLSLDHHGQVQAQAQLCYVQCNLCDTVLAVSVPSSNSFKTVTIRCGHCTNLLPVNLGALLLPPSAANHFTLGYNLFSPSHIYHGEMPNPTPNLSLNQPSGATNYMNPTPSSRGGGNELNRPPTSNRPPEKRQRVPSAYNRFIKDEIQRIKAENPDISHREAFSAAAKNWAHFPHIHFGLMPDRR